MKNNLDLNIKAFDSNVSISVDDDKITIKLDTNKLKINFDTDSNEITLTKCENDSKANVGKTRGRPKKLNAFISEDIKEEVKEPIKPDIDIKEKELDLYWENGVLKHKNEEPVEKTVEEQEEDTTPTDLEFTKCGRCGKVAKLTNIKLNEKFVCKSCANDIRDEIKSRVIVNKIIRSRGEDFLYD